ncbi:hypothetical protein A2276_00210 [candidate division WOR-1 bacterium RIFOXYA12_FULL_43_27]|uniref:Calcineurin-like phosphoesterase domain-containing protein n=1 Tax=candidate division WOR-1 bacterium RIFOXYC2_FULL_46_14 TaxID=1802587 RepID=A0A1F4U4I9_UNCSA|nr:MAG: hypothetical protein A2276_00210 [candidate division WOR-1 bacterium RIFOXYA12_FULL_43_27]OGC20879.1 MAG: hypothetical protein A2292_07665 [candidate division WOR-1 bacterium RIFOXYB2_FULL_46_45]OGC31383.1 MAG: hypothetical protein A2232_03780 [candidate division WOR-1 bacterium RIFOXYA2_FULL_46_56]OGC39789.1 MAG: hypothetical protein A2438_04615 [candidate division WOR-1 bacterium RIFOXYC2_FULL_46_14]
MKALFVTDLHGCEWKYERLFEAAKELGAEIVINGGDLFPKSEDLFAQEKFIKNYLDKYFARFNSAGIYYLCSPGNDDLMTFDELFLEVCKKYPFIIPLAQRKVEIGGFEFIGMNWVVDYPFRLKDRCRMDTKNYVFQAQFGTGLLSTPNGFKEISDWPAYARTLPTIEDELNRLVRPRDMEKSVYVIHMPPYGIGLDKCGHGAEVGSKAIYNFLLKNQPKLSLHGHIHESPKVSGQWQVKLGETICVQPGQLDEFTYVTIDLSDMKLDRISELS